MTGPARQLGLLGDDGSPDGAWRVRASERARRLAVRVLPGGLVEIVVPRGTRPRAVEQFVSRHRRWIERTVDLYRPAGADATGALPDTIHFPASGRTYGVTYVGGIGAPRLSVAAGALSVAGALDRTALVRRALQRFTMREAHAALAPWLAELSAATSLGYSRMQIRRQRTRWGSCSPTGTISLNACLMFQPPPVVNYLLIHELAHTRHFNHSRRYWRLVERFEPDWHELDAALSRGWRAVPAWALA
ncbi:MAG TPA: SprT family zinc-dependent metalloprotease [Steroidobacteraceae bacterium]|nr:SprT family zinc-dependent metalloprotease [Steroidobacteraceae bacterium]